MYYNNGIITDLIAFGQVALEQAIAKANQIRNGRCKAVIEDGTHCFHIGIFFFVIVRNKKHQVKELSQQV